MLEREEHLRVQLVQTWRGFTEFLLGLREDPAFPHPCPDPPSPGRGKALGAALQGLWGGRTWGGAAV